MGRKPVIAGNWKMHTLPSEGARLAADLARLLKEVDGVDVVIAPPYTHLSPVEQRIKSSPVKLAAQNLNANDFGAYTGEVSCPMLKELGCEYVIIGHSERRQYYGETDQSVNEKVQAAVSHNLIPILCVGETLDERESGRTLDVILSQLEGGLKGLSKESAMIIIVAYEPVWAIGTGKTATDEQAQEVHLFIRNSLSRLFDEGLSRAARILYGGSVKPENIDGLMTQPDIDGALVGGASLKAEIFERIVKFKKG
ncbi:MAG: triose-phosphate isomerase [Deltaproteobacteria bacterium]|nr:triose-phosphate isomerase [Deltaproteobacteria bacterium]